MSGKLERIKWQMLSFISDEEIKKQFNELYEKVVEANKNDLTAFVPIGRFQENKTNVGNLNYIEDYEIDTYIYKDSEGNEWESEAEYSQAIEEKADKLFEQYSVEETDNDEWIIRNEQGEIVEDSLNDEDEANEKLEELKQDWINDNTEDLEQEYDEIYWNIVINYNNHVDKDVAQKVGLGVLTITNDDRDDDGDSYLFLQGCGMDMSPKYMAYQALAYGYIDEEFISMFRPTSIDYTKYVVGSSWNDVIERLGIEKFLTEKVEE
jgi:hypothetical protein